MPPLSLILVITAAILHAGWNLFLKQVEEKYIITWWSLLISAILLSPLVVAGGWPDRAAWPYLIASALVEALYMIALISAYNLSDFSLVYPIARGAAPAFLALWTVLFLGETISPLGGVGLALIVGGLMVVGSSGLLASHPSASANSNPDPKPTEAVTTRNPLRSSLSNQFSNSAPASHSDNFRRFAGPLLAVLVAVLISIYSTIDGAAVKLTPATPYTVVMLGMTGLFFTPFAIRRNGWQHAVTVGRRYFWRILFIGGAGMLAYILVLNAYAIGQVSYAGAVREVSVVFGALAGWKLLGEGFGLQRAIGAAGIFAGIILIALT